MRAGATDSSRILDSLESAPDSINGMATLVGTRTLLEVPGLSSVDLELYGEPCEVYSDRVLCLAGVAVWYKSEDEEK